MGSCSELHAKFWDGANSSSGFMSKPSEVREFCTELMQSHKLSKFSVDWPNCICLRKGGNWSKSLRENELSFKQNSRLCKFYIISGFTASIFRTLSLSFFLENGTWSPVFFRKASKRSTEERKFAKFLLNKTPHIFTPNYSYFSSVHFPKQTHMQPGGPDVSFPTFKCTV